MIVSIYGDPLELLKLPRVLSASISFNGVIGPLVQVNCVILIYGFLRASNLSDLTQMFFADRVRVVSGQLYVPLLCCALSLVRGVLTFVTMARGLHMINITRTLEQVKVIIPTLLGVGAAVDVILTATLSYYIGRRKRRYLVFYWWL